MQGYNIFVYLPEDKKKPNFHELTDKNTGRKFFELFEPRIEYADRAPQASGSASPQPPSPDAAAAPAGPPALPTPAPTEAEK
jgi:hypothetical protein